MGAVIRLYNHSFGLEEYKQVVMNWVKESLALPGQDNQIVSWGAQQQLQCKNLPQNIWHWVNALPVNYSSR